MFAKLLKHEWQSTRGMIGLLCLIVFVSGLLVGGILRYMTWSAVTGNGFMVILYTVVLTAAILAIVGSCFGTMYLLVYRFYKSRFTDEGYLIFTLPVTEHQLLLSSVANTAVGVVIVALVTCITASLTLGIFLTSFQEPASSDIVQILLDTASGVGTELGVYTETVFLMLLDMIISFFAELVVLMLAVTIGALAGKHPILKGLGFYFAVSIADSVVTAAFTGSTTLSVTAQLFCNIGLNVAVAAGGYFLMHDLIRNRLNLT